MKKYISISLRAKGAKATSSPFGVGIPALTQVSGFIDAIRHISEKLKCVPMPITGWAFGYSNAHLHGEMNSTPYKRQFALSTLKNTGETSVPPVPKIDLDAHFILEFNDDVDIEQTSSVIKSVFDDLFIDFCGGQIDHRKTTMPRIVASMNDIPSALWVIDSCQELYNCKNENPDKTLLECMAYLTLVQPGGREFFPNTMGYVALQDEPVIRHSRHDHVDEDGNHHGNPHVFVEAAIGIVSEMHTTRLKESIIETTEKFDPSQYQDPQYSSMLEILSKIIFRKQIDSRKSMYLHQAH